MSQLSESSANSAVSISANASVPPHLPALDGLRGIAILLVLVHMLNQLVPQPGIVDYVFNRISHFGWAGVQLFFGLSGFLITGILLDSQRAKNYYSGFYARRTLRIFPLYFGVLFIAFVILPAVSTVPVKIAADQPNQIWLWTYLSNWASTFGEGSKAFPHFWSLAVEEQFYLVWPLLIRFRDPRRCVHFCLTLALASLLLRTCMVWAGVSEDAIYLNSLCRMDALVLGGAAAAAFRVDAWRARMIAMHNRFLLWCLLLTGLGACITRGFWNGTLVGLTVGYTIVAAMFALLIIAAVAAEAAGAGGWVNMLRFRPLRAIGKYSYAMYVFHKPLHDLAGKPLLNALNIDVSTSVAMNAAYISIGVVATFVLAFISWHAYEKHFLRLKRLFTPQY